MTIDSLIQVHFESYATPGSKGQFLQSCWEIIRYRKGFGKVADAIRAAVSGVQEGYAEKSEEAHDSLDLMGIHPSNEEGMFAFYPAGHLSGNLITLYGWGLKNTIRAARGLHKTDEFTHQIGETDEFVSPDAVPFTVLAKLALIAADEWMKETDQ